MFSPFCRQTFALCRLALELHTAPPCWVRLNYNDSQYKAGYNKSHILLCITRGGIRTPDLLVRSQTLYPTELRTLIFNCHAGTAITAPLVNLLVLLPQANTVDCAPSGFALLASSLAAGQLSYARLYSIVTTLKYYKQKKYQAKNLYVIKLKIIAQFIFHKRY